MKPILKSLIASLALVTLSSASADAAVIFTLPTPTVDGSIVITQDINFTMTTAGGPLFMVFDEWVTNDGTRNLFSAASISPNFSRSVNGGATGTSIWDQIQDNNFALNDVTLNDGYLKIGTTVGLTAGDVYTVKAATYTLAAGSLPVGFNPQAAQTFTGEAFLAGASLNRLSANTSVGAVPEPSRAMLTLAGLGGVALRRRRKQVA